MRTKLGESYNMLSSIVLHKPVLVTAFKTHFSFHLVAPAPVPIHIFIEQSRAIEIGKRLDALLTVCSTLIENGFQTLEPEVEQWFTFQITLRSEQVRRIKNCIGSRSSRLLKSEK